MNHPLTLREDPTVTNREITSRTLTLRAASADDKTRSVEVIMATDAPVTVFDWERGIIDEVLVADGGSFPETMPLLRDHARYSIDCVLGSVRGARRDGSAWKGRAYFAENDEDCERAWNKVRQGHLTDVSIGYRTTDFEDIPPNTTRNVAGRDYTAGERWLRISRRWEAKELSLVPIGADRNAKVREQSPSTRATHSGASTMDQLRQYLVSLGLRRDATEEQAKAFHSALGGEHKTRADAIAAGTMTFAQATRAEGDAPAEEEESTEGEREGDVEAEEEEEEEVRAKGGKRSKPGKRDKSTNRRDPQAIAQDAIRAERKRAADIRELAGADVPAELVSRAVDQGWTPDRAAREFLQSVRSNRSESVGVAPGGIVRSHERDCTRQTIGMAMVMRSGVNVEAYAKRNNIADWANLAQRADRYRDMSMVDVAREAIRLDGREVPHTRDEVIRAAVSGGSFSQIFTTSVNARLTQGYDEEVDTTQGWVEETDEADFKTNTAIKYYGQTALEKLGRGGTAKDAAPSDAGEDYKVARYAKKFTVDEQDIIDDSFGALMTQPYEFGVAARRLRPDLVYAILLANPTLSETTGALFNSTALTTAGGHANLTTGALAASTLQTAITLMMKQYIGVGKNKTPLNINPQFLIVPSDLSFTAEILLNSAERYNNSDNGSYNPLKNKMQLRVDSRISAIGVTDPDSGTAYTGTATNYFLASRPGRTLRVAYRRGTGRAPMVRSFVLEQGQWGLGWDINMDIGAKAIDFRGLVKSTGA